ncbi:MAG: SPOR domain-containing protein [Candidatus Omnitrophota bacterium]
MGFWKIEEKSENEKLNEGKIRSKLYGEYLDDHEKRSLQRDADSWILNERIQTLKKEIDCLRQKVEKLNRQKTGLKKRIIRERILKNWLNLIVSSPTLKKQLLILLQVIVGIIILTVLLYSVVLFAKNINKAQPEVKENKLVFKEAPGDKKQVTAPLISGTYYVIQLAEYENIPMAEMQRSKLANEGWDVFLYKTKTSSDKQRTRIYLGKFKTHAEAAGQLALVKAKYSKFNDSFIRKIESSDE